ncbi:enoyl-CoA hydratase/isomerase family protein [Nocardioides sp. Y6]|uniref:Enoyl-CoA hydratase/isomerase family protein n=1 Tax=Nocardioides malaquae TaxID=2773426 RepID=A0ABR9RWM8_9ACTN|nr:enoyl-CoA hydratase-related protein [Nocardioides malaquae]MBE7325987.1 enoyl-CoA hydratase/isomerase family protein [Nocardioides malaquae]
MSETAETAETPAELVHYATADGIATITLDSPHNRNALSRQLVTELLAHLQTADADPDVRVVLVQSSGKVFCSGADLSEAASVGMEEGARTIVGIQRLVATMDKVVVTKNLGAVRAGGIGLVAAADVAISAETATFALTEVKLGLAPAAISLSVFHRMSPRAASLAALSGETFSGTDAAAYGLVTKAVPADELDAFVDDLVAKIATGANQGIRETKKLLNADLVARIDEREDHVATTSARLFASEEAREAMMAFLSRPKG